MGEKKGRPFEEKWKSPFLRWIHTNRWHQTHSLQQDEKDKTLPVTD